MSSPLTARQAPPAGSYALDPARTSVNFVTRHMFGLAPVRGTLSLTGGVLTIAELPEDSRVEAEADAASFSTGNAIRDQQVRSAMFLYVRRHPAITFRSTAIRSRGNGWMVSGVLTVKGQSAVLNLSVTDAAVDGTAVVFRASGSIDRYAHGITMMRGMAARRLSVEITAYATKA
jgi:polyisoprenoid-binding protein YceI